VLGVEQFAGIFVDDVLQGSVITFRGPADGAPGEIINEADIIQVLADGSPAPVEFEEGDTLFVIPTTAMTDQVQDPPTQTDLERLRTNQVNFRIGTDVEVNKQTGELIDITQSSYEDPSNLALKEILGQRPMEPQTDIEGKVSFVNSRTEPLLIPALEGIARNDSGEETIPYLHGSGSELEALRRADQTGVSALFVDSPVPSAVFPEEVYGTDGKILAASAGGFPPATLLSDQNVKPVATAGFYTPNSGVGDVEQYDLLLVQVGLTGALLGGSMGILSVGEAAWDVPLSKSLVEPPRFVTQSRKGDPFRYLLGSAMAHLSTTGTTGVVVSESGGNTIFDCSTTSLVFDDGHGTGAGGLNNIVGNSLFPTPYLNENLIEISIWDQTTGIRLERISLYGDPTGSLGPPGRVSEGGLGQVLHVNPPTFVEDTITVPATGFVDFSALGGTPPGPEGPFDITILVNTSRFLPSGNPRWSGSVTGFVYSDRLTFSESYDLSTALPAGTLTASGAVNVETELNVKHVTMAFSDEVTVNDVAEVNGSILLNFIERIPGGGVGTFAQATTPGSGDEEGTLKVMGWQGFSNTALASTQDFVFAAVPSSAYDETGLICDGKGWAGDDDQYNNRVTEIEVNNGAIPNIAKGDILVIDKAGNEGGDHPGAFATTKAGTYLVRQFVKSDDDVAHPDRREVDMIARVGDGVGWIPIQFPTVVSYNDTTKELVLSTLDPFPNPTIITSPSGHAWATSGRVYLIINQDDLDDPLFATFSAAVLSAAYTGVDTGNKKLTGLSDFRDAGNAVIASSVFEAAAVAGTTVSGMVYFPLQIGGEQGLPEDNIVGRDITNSPFGFRYLRLLSDVVSGSTANVLDFVGGTDLLKEGAGGSVVLIGEKTEPASTSFITDESTPVYPNIPGSLNIAQVAHSRWVDIRENTGHPDSLVDCLLLGDRFQTVSSTSDPGFWAQAGIFVEPSFPRPIFDLGSLTPAVVDSLLSLPATRIGFRALSDFSPISDNEQILFQVRRIRRFHDPITTLSQALLTLRLLYEIRRGVITNISSSSADMTLLEATGGTQFGLFDNREVNVNPGDQLRILDSGGEVLETLEIIGVPSPTELLLADPGVLGSVIGNSFEIYLRQPPVPHEQSNEQLLSQGFEEILVSEANYTTNDGGFVQDSGDYASDINILRDTTVTGAGLNNFSALGVQVGDYLVIDPAGELPVPGGPVVPEKGVRPFGDTSVPARVTPYVAGKPRELDDNRGYYRVVQVNLDNVQVTSVSEFTGDITTDVIFGSVGKEYAIYPTVTGSVLGPGGVEGQGDLRPTAFAGTNGSPAGSFTGNDFSVGPFSYRIFRPSTLLSQQAVELILMMRERMLSWIESLQDLALAESTYFIFQRDLHAWNLLLGVYSNAILQDLLGLTNVAPFANDADALSVLDRRFWVRDFELDFSAPPFGGGGPPFYAELTTGEGRPVLPDLIGLVLERRDTLRSIRNTWLDFRTNLLSGTLATIRRFEEQQPRREEEQRMLLDIIKSTS
jgi:hypothetical protein